MISNWPEELQSDTSNRYSAVILKAVWTSAKRRCQRREFEPHLGHECNSKPTIFGLDVLEK